MVYLELGLEFYPSSQRQLDSLDADKLDSIRGGDIIVSLKGRPHQFIPDLISCAQNLMIVKSWDFKTSAIDPRETKLEEEKYNNRI